jgi:hypothetical protein
VWLDAQESARRLLTCFPSGSQEMLTNGIPNRKGRSSHVLSPEVSKQIYDSPASLPGNHRWVTKEEDDVRTVERLLGIPESSIGASPVGEWRCASLSAVRARDQSARPRLLCVDEGPPEGVAGRGDSRRPPICQRRGAARDRRSLLPQLQESDRRPAQLQMSQLGVCTRGISKSLKNRPGHSQTTSKSKF